MVSVWFVFVQMERIDTEQWTWMNEWVEEVVCECVCVCGDKWKTYRMSKKKKKRKLKKKKRNQAKSTNEAKPKKGQEHPETNRFHELLVGLHLSSSQFQLN